MFKRKDLAIVRRRRTVEIEEEEIDDNDSRPVVAEPARPAARVRDVADPWKPGLGLYIIIGVIVIFLGFLFANSILGGGGLPHCDSLPAWNPNAPCR